MKDKIEQLLKELSDFSNAKVGDKVFSFLEGELEIEFIGKIDSYPIKTKFSWYSLNGKYHLTDKFPTLFKRNPYEAIAELFSNNNGFEEKWMMVSNGDEHWYKRKIIFEKDGFYYGWRYADSEDKIKKGNEVFRYSEAKEIEEEKNVELTLEEIAEKFNINVKNLKIKK